MTISTELRLLLRHPVDFEVADEPAESRFVFATPDGERRARASEAVGALSQGIRTTRADPSVRAWATPAILALRLMARGELTTPGVTERNQLQDAARAVDPDPVTARVKVEGFLAALAQESPAVATTPQGGVSREGDAPPVVPRARPRQRVFAARLEIGFLPQDSPDDAPEGGTADDEAGDPPVAEVTLRVKPTDTGWGWADAADLWRREDHHFGAGSRESVQLLLGRAADAWAPLGALLRLLKGQAPLRVTADELAELGSSRVAARLQAERVEVDWPAELVRELETHATVRADTARDSGRPRFFDAQTLFRFDWEIAVGGDALTAEELDELAASQHGLLRLRDQWVFVDPSRLRRVLDERTRTITSVEALRAAATGTLEVDGLTTEVSTVGWLDEIRQRLAARGEQQAVEQPDDLAGELRDYQLLGLRWMVQLVELGLGGILADDMGLGKTVMLIALHLHRAERSREQGRPAAPTLVVCPASVLGNWEREVQRFAPGVPVRRLHGPGRTLDGAHEGFVLTTYATMRRDVESLREQPSGWGLVVADEAQNVKNPASGTARALRTIDSEVNLALTGTPVENNLDELWALLDWTTPGLLGGQQEFRTRWSRRVEAGDGDRAARLSGLIAPFVLRRRKSDPGIAPELPPKVETDYRVSLTREQVGLYEAVVRRTMSEVEAATGMARRGLVVKLLTQLKQICNHPAQFLRQPDAPLRGRSGKLVVLDELLDDIVPSGSAALLFTQYARMGDLLQRHLEERGIGSQFLHGGVPLRQREQMVRRFQDGEVPVFVLSLRAAGTGLNLTRADHVIHVDRWWNPAVEDQATDRAHRIGQTQRVQVHRLISEGTIEESVAELIAAKRTLADAVVNAGEGALTELTDAELADLVRLRS